MTAAVIPITANNGWDFCPSCTFCESETCEFCDEGDQFEESDESVHVDRTASTRELSF